MREASQIPFTPLHELEVLNAFELLVGRGLITRDECESVQVQLDDDIESQRLLRVSTDFERIFTNASEISQKHTAKALTRSLDLLHVAAARAARCTTFVSADDRQLVVAKATGLTAIDIKRPQRRHSS